MCLTHCYKINFDLRLCKKLKLMAMVAPATAYRVDCCPLYQPPAKRHLIKCSPVMYHKGI
jgi:hypothetical protein